MNAMPQRPLEHGPSPARDEELDKLLRADVAGRGGTTLLEEFAETNHFNPLFDGNPNISGRR